MSYAEITMKSGAVVTVDVSSIQWERTRNLLGEVTGEAIKWTIKETAVRRPVHLDPDEIAAVVFVDPARAEPLE